MQVKTFNKRKAANAEDNFRLGADERVRRDFVEFVKAAWPIVEPTHSYVHNWHVEAICKCLQAVSNGEIQKLVINIPPGFAKSLLVSVLWPAWVWLRKPEWRGIFTSYGKTLTDRDSGRCRDLIESAWYQGLIRPDRQGNKWQLKSDTNRKDYFVNTNRGHRVALPITSSTGWRGDCVISDDPISADGARSVIERENVIAVWDGQLSSRLDDFETGSHVLIMQRLHEADLSGHCLAKGGYEHLMLPMEFDPARRSVVRFQRGPRKGQVCCADPRTRAGELLFPARVSAEVLQKLKKEMGVNAEGQLNQQPIPLDGNLFKRKYWGFWKPDGTAGSGYRPEGCDTRPARTLPQHLDIAISLDAAFKGLETSDFCVFTVWGIEGANRFLLEMRRDQMDFLTTLQNFRELAKKYPKAMDKIVEAKANGDAIINVLSNEISGIQGITPEGGKEARAAACQPEIAAGQVYLPEEPWVEDFVNEFATFPRGRHDDIVDSTTQALIFFKDNEDVINLRSLGKW